MTRRITDDELARRILEVLGNGPITDRERKAIERWPRRRILRRLRALRDEGRVVEVAGPRGSLWRLP